MTMGKHIGDEMEKIPLGSGYKYYKVNNKGNSMDYLKYLAEDDYLD